MTVEAGSGWPSPAGVFASALYRWAPSGSLVEVRFRAGSGMGRRFVEVEQLDRVVETILSLASGTDVYVGVVPRRCRGGGRADLVERASVVWADCDGSASVAALRQFRPMPGMVVGSGSAQNCHAYWFLGEPVVLDVIERVNQRLALALGADARCSDPARILRPAGSVNRKHSPPAAVRLLRCAAQERVDVAELKHRLPAQPSPPPAARSPRRRPASADRDRLGSIPPREYFERLTGQRVGHSGKVRCPFHEDATPSLHVYERPGQGWYCFGCGRGGSVFDLAALLWSLGRSGGVAGSGLRGRAFLEVRDRLAAELDGRELG